MGIIECKLDDSYKKNEMEKELKMKEDEGSLCIIEYNKTKIYEKNRISNELNKNINENKCKNNSNKNEQFINDKCLSIQDFDCDSKNKNNDNLKININNKREIINNNNDEDLIIVTPTNIKLMHENNNNEITDDHTIKNETLVYNFEKKYSKDINKKLNESKNINNKDNRNNDINKQKMNNSKSFVVKKRIVTKKVNINNIKKEINKDIPKNKNMKNRSNNKNIDKKRIMTNNLNSRSYNNIRNLKSCLIPPLFDYSFLNNNDNENQQSSTLQNQNIQLKNIILQQLKEDILPNVERKTYQEDFLPLKEKNKSNNKFYFESKKNNIKYDKALYNKLSEEQNKYLLFGDNDNKLIIDKLKNIYQVLYNKNNNKLINEKIYKKINKNKIKIDLNKNMPIYRNGTNFHLRNKSYNIENNFSMNNDNNSYFSLFNNSTNLSINFINKANKCNKSERNCKKVIPFFYRDKNKKKNKINNNGIRKKEVVFNQFLNYNNFNKNNYSNKKNRKNKTYIKKVKPVIFNSRSCNNIFNNEKRLNYSNNDINMNHINLLSHEYRDLVEVNMPKLEEETLININIINNLIGNKYFYSYKKIDNYMNDTILYDGILYKVIDNIDNDNKNNKYQLLERYFQITKNCFKYYNHIKDAIHEKDKPLVQFDIRYIEKIEIIENNFLKNYKINEEKDIKIIFCIYINQNNDFFIFAHKSNFNFKLGL